MDQKYFIAHKREQEPKTQSVEEHLKNTAAYAGKYAGAVGFEDFGELMGLLHDIGKYSSCFQGYICPNSGFFDQDNDSSDGAGDGALQKGRIDHSTAGGQFFWQKIQQFQSHDKRIRSYAAEMAALAIFGHHGGLMDVVDADGADNFWRRLCKDTAETHYEEAKAALSTGINKRLDELFRGKFLDAIEAFIERRDAKHKKISSSISGSDQFDFAEDRLAFDIGMFEKFMFSCLVDADRCDTIDYCQEGAAEARQDGRYVSWETLAQRLEKYLSSFNQTSHVNEIRAKISDDCLHAALRGRGIFTLTVPTGGGKTLASLRYAIELAKLSLTDGHPIERIIYVIPYTTIIDQNAGRVRDILEQGCERGSVVLECHSNLLPDKNSWTNELLSENWDAPIIFTTSVQFLDALFSGGMKDARRLHQLANSIVIFDEIQTLPLKTVHLFCSAINLFVQEFGMSALLCSATQPLLNGVEKRFGALEYDESSEIMPDAKGLFEKLHRVDILDARKKGGYSTSALSSFICEKQREYQSVLAIVNTTSVARDLYNEIKSNSGGLTVLHLSAKMCPAHRKTVIDSINKMLAAGEPLICVSTAVMEAGIDVDFACGMRSLSGFDSMAQAAGRCNREGKRSSAPLYIVNPADENLNKLPEIRIAQQASQEVLDLADTEEDAEEIFMLKNIKEYFERYFYKRSNEMKYDVRKDRDDTLLNLLSKNRLANDGRSSKRKLRQAFAAAGSLFKLIDAPTEGVIVPYGEGASIICNLSQEQNPKEVKKLLRMAQLYSVNLYPFDLGNLLNKGAITLLKLLGGTASVYVLQPEFYNNDFGVSGKQDGKFKFEIA